MVLTGHFLPVKIKAFLKLFLGFLYRRVSLLTHYMKGFVRYASFKRSQLQTALTQIDTKAEQVNSVEFLISRLRYFKTTPASTVLTHQETLLDFQ